MIRRLLACLIAVLVGFSLLTVPAYAHVLISDDSKSIGAVLHLTPDDDPVAGQKSSLYFDLQGQKANVTGTSLEVTNDTTKVTSTVPIKVEGPYVAADYTFPSQGVYTLTLVVSSNKTYTFNYTQRGWRGLLGSSPGRQSYPLANVALVVSTMGLLLLVVLAFNHKKAILRKSTF